jgi:spermidine synthase
MQALGKSPGLVLAAFVSGACSMLVEIAGARLVAPYLGNTIYTWASAIAMVLAALSIGYYLGGILADKYNDRKHFSTILLMAGLLTLAVPVLGNTLVPFTILLDISSASLISSFILVPASLFYGMVSPYAIKLTCAKGREGQSAGRIFAISTLGSILGALSTGFLLIPNMMLTHIFVLAACLMVAMSWVASFKKSSLVIDLPIFLVLAAACFHVGYAHIVDGQVVHEEETEYYHIAVIDAEIDGEPARLLMLDRDRSTSEREGGEPAFGYVKLSRLSYELVENPGNALVVGAAGGTQIEDLKRHFPGIYVDGVEIDGRVVELGKEYFSLEDDERTSLYIEDARRYLRKTDKHYDLVLLDAFRSRSLPPHLTTVEFFGELREKMSPEGVVLANMISSLEGDDSEVFLRLHSTFSSVFANVLVLPVRGEAEGLQNILIIATDADVDGFREAHKDEIYAGEIASAAPLTDELNPIEVYVPG